MWGGGGGGAGLHTFVLTCFVQVCLVGAGDYLAVTAGRGRDPGLLLIGGQREAW